jgi:cellulose synthase/poly-beta-1,6-N-acetylglucosamine synthase-like glycosyltransferase
MVSSLIGTLCHPRYREAGVALEIWFVTGDSLISRARNDCANAFLRSDADALMFIDSDLTFEPLGVLQLWETGLSLVGGNYPLSHRSVSSEEQRAVVPIPSGTREICAISRVATGFMMIRRECLTKMQPELDKYQVEDHLQTDFFSPFVDDNEYLSEDYAFVTRARRAGVTPYIHQGIVLGHIGRQEWRLDKYEAKEATRAA